MECPHCKYIHDQRDRCPDEYEAIKKAEQLEAENARLKQHVEDLVKDANNQSREIIRLRGVIEEAIEYVEQARKLFKN